MAGINEQDMESPMETEACELRLLSLAQRRELETRRSRRTILEEVSQDTIQVSGSSPRYILSNESVLRDVLLGGSHG